MSTPFRPFEKFPVILAKDLPLDETGDEVIRAGKQVQAHYIPSGRIYLLADGLVAHSAAVLGTDFTLANPTDQARLWTRPQFKPMGNGLWGKV